MTADITSNPLRKYPICLLLVCRFTFIVWTAKSYLGTERAQRDCRTCGTPFDPEMSYHEGNYFVRLPVEDQLRNILQNKEVINALDNRNLEIILNDRSYKDIIYGHQYKNLLQQGIIGQNDILLLNTDGINIFKSSNYSVWPILATVNTLPPYLRRKHDYDYE